MYLSSRGSDGVGKKHNLRRNKEFFTFYSFEIKTSHHSFFGKEARKKKVEVKKKKIFLELYYRLYMENFHQQLRNYGFLFGHFLLYSKSK